MQNEFKELFQCRYSHEILNNDYTSAISSIQDCIITACFIIFFDILVFILILSIWNIPFTSSLYFVEKYWFLLMLLIFLIQCLIYLNLAITAYKNIPLLINAHWQHQAYLKHKRFRSISYIFMYSILFIDLIRFIVPYETHSTDSDDNDLNSRKELGLNTLFRII